VKNGEGADSPATSRAALQKLWASWLVECGVQIEFDDGGAPLRPIEISSRLAGDAEQLRLALEGVVIAPDGPILLR
jgi:hypothetical protein